MCVTRTCKRYLNNNITYKELDLSHTLEACLNDSLWKDYKLQGKLVDINYCNKENDRITIDSSDITVAVVYLVLIMLNVAGSLYDVFFLEKDHPGNSNKYNI